MKNSLVRQSRASYYAILCNACTINSHPTKIERECFNMKVVQTTAAPAAIGPYSQGWVSGNLLFTSGQIPLDPATGEVVGTEIVAQAHQALKNLSAIVLAAGTSIEQVVKTTCFVADMNDFAAFNEVYASYFPNRPARSCVAVKTLPKGVLCEVECIAEISSNE